MLAKQHVYLENQHTRILLYHPWNIKILAFRSFLERLLHIPMNTLNFNKELDAIKLTVITGPNTAVFFKVTQIIATIKKTLFDFFFFRLFLHSLIQLYIVSFSATNDNEHMIAI